MVFFLSMIIFLILLFIFYPWCFSFSLLYDELLKWQLCWVPLPWGKTKNWQICVLTDKKLQYILQKKKLRRAERKIKQKIEEKSFSWHKLKWLIDAVEVQKMQIDFCGGMGNSFYTALAIGFLRALLGAMGAVFFTVLGNMAHQPVYRIVPNFEKSDIQARIQCIVTITFGNIIYKRLKTINWLGKRSEQNAGA